MEPETSSYRSSEFSFSPEDIDLVRLATRDTNQIHDAEAMGNATVSGSVRTRTYRKYPLALGMQELFGGVSYLLRNVPRKFVVDSVSVNFPNVVTTLDRLLYETSRPVEESEANSPSYNLKLIKVGDEEEITAMDAMVKLRQPTTGLGIENQYDPEKAVRIEFTDKDLSDFARGTKSIIGDNLVADPMLYLMACVSDPLINDSDTYFPETDTSKQVALYSGFQLKTSPLFDVFTNSGLLQALPKEFDVIVDSNCTNDNPKKLSYDVTATGYLTLDGISTHPIYQFTTELNIASIEMLMRKAGIPNLPPL